MPVIAGSIAALGSIAGSVLGGNSQEKAAKRQAGVTQDIFNRTSALNQPYMYAGNAALNPLLSLYGIDAGLPTNTSREAGVVGQATPEQQAAAMNLFYSSPEYTVQKQALDQALERQASAGGVRYSPSTALGKAEIAGRAFGDWRNNLASLAQMGPNAANQQGTNLQNLGAGLSTSIANMGNARMNMIGGIGQTVADLGGQYGQYKAYQDRTNQLSQLFAPQAPANFGSVQPPMSGLFQGQMPAMQEFKF